MEPAEESKPSEKPDLLKTEDELEEELHRKTGLFRNIRIARNEWPRVLHISLLFGLITLVHTTMGNLRDMVVMGRQDPMSIFFIKSLLLPPCSLFFVWLIQLGLNMFSPSRVFDITLVAFSCCYAVFGLVVWPLKVHIQKDVLWSRDIFSDGKMESIRCQFLYPVFLVFNEWTSSFLFLCSEMWGALVVSYFFNVFANEASTKRQARRYISVYNIFNALSILGSSIATLVFDRWRNSGTFEDKETGFKISILLSSLTIACTLALKKYAERNILSVRVFSATSEPPSRTEKKRLGFGEEVRDLLRSRLLLAISSVILFYGIASTLIEATFKSGLAAGARHTNSSKETYSNFYNSAEQIITSVASLVIVNTPFTLLVMGSGWGYVAFLPVAAVLFSFVSVFPMAFYNTACTQDGGRFLSAVFWGRGPSFFLENNLGLLSSAFLKIGKYLGSDVTKEAISMQIDPAYRAKYKAVYDGFCGKFGKSLGSILCAVMAAVWDISDIRRIALVSWVIVGVLSVLWIYSVIYLNRKYQESLRTNTYIDVDKFGLGSRCCNC